MTDKLTDEEREKLKKLSVDDLVDMVGTLREESEKNSKKFAEERANIMKSFLNGESGGGEDEGDSDVDLTAPAFKRLFAKQF